MNVKLANNRTQIALFNEIQDICKGITTKKEKSDENQLSTPIKEKDVK